jgi:hypothetical protein
MIEFLAQAMTEFLVKKRIIVLQAANTVPLKNETLYWNNLEPLGQGSFTVEICK